MTLLKISEAPSKRLAAALALLVLSLPFERILFHIGPFSVSSVELCYVLFAATFCLTGSFEKQLLSESLLLSAGFFVLALFLSAFLQESYRLNAVKFSLRMLAGFFLAWALASLVRREAAWNSVLQLIFAVTGGLAALLGLLEWFLPPKATAWSWLFRNPPHWIGGLKRLTGTFEYPNTAASFLLFSLAASISLGLSGKKFYRLITIVIMPALVLTYSRGAVIAGAASLLLVALRGYKTEKQRETIVWICILALMSALVVWFVPRLTHRLTSENDTTWLGAGYEILSFPRSLDPDRIYRVPLRLKNTGAAAWDENLPFRLSYHWYDAKTLQVVVRDGLRTVLPATIPPGGEITVDAALKTPPRPGDFILAFDMVQERFAWFSERGVAPTLIRCQVGPSESLASPLDFARTISGVMDRGFVVTTRFDLWQAAWQLFLQHKWIGVGPDNYRFHYERVLGRPPRFTSMYANNLFLEILADAGIIGFTVLAVFLCLLLRKLADAGPGACPRGSLGRPSGSGGVPLQAASIALAAFLVHGMVDYLLEFSPIYVSFWLFTGLVAGSTAAQPRQQEHAYRD